MPTFAPEALRGVARAILEAVATPADSARMMSDSLVEANLAGHDSHGVLRLPSYVEAVRQGRVRPAARPAVTAREGATATVDAAHGWGQPAAQLAARTAVELAGASGVGAVTIADCSHVGRLGEYVESMAAAGLIGLALCNAEPAVAAYGAAQRLLGTNPIACAVPRGADLPPVLVDFATAAVAEGKLQIARAKGEPVAEGLILDRDGHATRDPAAFYDGGMLLPFGLHKGYGISVMIELLGGALSGKAPCALPEYSGGNGALLLALNIEAFVPRAQFLAQVNGLCAAIKAARPAERFAEVLLPGEPEARARQRRLAEGIVLPDQTWRELVALASDLDVTL